MGGVARRRDRSNAITIDLSPLLAELDTAIKVAEQQLLSAQLNLAEMRGKRAGVVLAVEAAQQAIQLELPTITEGDGDG